MFTLVSLFMYVPTVSVSSGYLLRRILYTPFTTVRGTSLSFIRDEINTVIVEI